MPFVSVLTIIKLNNWNQSFYGYIFVTNDTAEQKLSITVNCEALRQLMQLIKKKRKITFDKARTRLIVTRSPLVSKSLSEVSALKTKVETFQVMTEILCLHIKWTSKIFSKS